MGVVEQVEDVIHSINVAIAEAKSLDTIETLAKRAILYVDQNWESYNPKKRAQTRHLNKVFNNPSRDHPSSRLLDDLRNWYNLLYLHWGKALEKAGRAEDALVVYRKGHEVWWRLVPEYGREWIALTDNCLRRLLVLTLKHELYEECLQCCREAGDSKREKRVLRKIEARGRRKEET